MAEDHKYIIQVPTIDSGNTTNINIFEIPENKSVSEFCDEIEREWMKAIALSETQKQELIEHFAKCETGKEFNDKYQRLKKELIDAVCDKIRYLTNKYDSDTIYLKEALIISDDIDLIGITYDEDPRLVFKAMMADSEFSEAIIKGKQSYYMSFEGMAWLLIQLEEERIER